MAWTDTKVDGVDTLPAAEYNSMVTAITDRVYMDHVSVTSAYTITIDTRSMFLCQHGTYTITLPPVAGARDNVYFIKNLGTGTITIDGNGAEEIDHDTTYDLYSQFETIGLYCSGASWYII